MDNGTAIDWLESLGANYFNPCITDACNIGVEAIKEKQKFAEKIKLIKSKYEDIQNGSASDMTLGWNRAIDMVLEILES